MGIQYRSVSIHWLTSLTMVSAKHTNISDASKVSIVQYNVDQKYTGTYYNYSTSFSQRSELYKYQESSKWFKNQSVATWKGVLNNSMQSDQVKLLCQI